MLAPTMEASRVGLDLTQTDNVDVATLSPKIAEIPPVARACLPFADHQDDDVRAAAPTQPVAVITEPAPDASEPPPVAQVVDPPVAQVVEPATDQVVRPAVDPDDPEANLEAMTLEQLRQEVAKLKASPDRRVPLVLRRATAVFLLRERESADAPSNADPEPVPVPAPAAKPQGPSESPRLKLETLVRRVKETAGPKAIDDLVERLAEDYHDRKKPSLLTYRGFAEGIRLGLIKPKTVVDAHRDSRKPGVDYPARLFVRIVLDASPEFDKIRLAKNRRGGFFLGGSIGVAERGSHLTARPGSAAEPW